MAKPKDVVVEICTKATLLGNKISVRMLEYLSTVKDRPLGFDQLAQEFLDICRVLWAIEAGLGEFARTNRKFPPDMITELERKFRGAYLDFQGLDKMIAGLLEYENRGTVGRIQKGWRKMFPGHEIDKMRASLAKTREAFKMSALVFQWSLGESTIDESVGIGYTGLAAALDRMTHMNRRTPTGAATSSSAHAHLVKAPEPGPGAVSMHDVQAEMEKHAQGQLPSLPSLPPVLPPMQSILTPDSGSPRQTVVRPVHHVDSGAAAVNKLPELSRHASMSTHSTSMSSHGTPMMARERVTSFTLEGLAGQLGPRETGPRVLSGSSSNPTEDTLVMQELDALDLNPLKVVKLKADPFTMPRWTPRNTMGGNAANMKTALVNAVRTANHNLIEQLLDRGVAPDTLGETTLVLNEAVVHQDTETIRLLLLFGADPNAADKDGVTPLFTAVEESFVEGATMLLKYGADPNRHSGPGEPSSPLAVAISASKTPLIQLLLMYGGDPNHSLPNGNTVLINSISKTTPKKLLELLLLYGADPDLKNNEGKTPLFEAINASRVDMVTALLDSGANPNLPGPKHMLWPSTWHPACLQVLLSHGADFKKTPGIMELAASINNIESVRLLLNAGVDPNAKKDGTYTALCTAIRDNRADIFDLLLSSGADPNVMASEYPAWKCVTHKRVRHFLPALVAAGADLTAPPGILEMAVATHNDEALAWLLDAGVDANARNAQGHTPLTTAIREGRTDAVALLLRRGADANRRGEDWPVCMAVRAPALLQLVLPAVEDARAHKGVLEMAVQAGQLESVRLLLAAGVSVEDKNGGVFSPLTTALREDKFDMVRFLLGEGGADPNSPGEHLPIVKAVRRYRDDMNMIELLLEKGADPNKVYRGWNAIMQAVENGDANVLRVLCEKGPGVDLDARDDAGRTVADIASHTGWEQAKEILLGKTGLAK